MKLIPHVTHQFNGIIWRMEIDPGSNTLFAEIRNEQDKLVSFASVNLASGKINFTDLTIDERWLTGIEAGLNGVLLLHHYQSAGSPTHKSIIAIDAATGQIIWSNYNITFSHMSVNGPVVFDARMQPRKLFTIDIKTSATLHNYSPSIDLDVDTAIVLPDMVSADEAGELPERPFGNIVHNLYANGYRIVSLHALKNDALSQSLYILEDGAVVYTDLLNTGIQKLQPEAFVLHNNHLVYLKNKVELKAINLEN
jgi:outer membrane protein assembly factor BamB